MPITTTTLSPIHRCASSAVLLALAFAGVAGCSDDRRITATDGPPIEMPAAEVGEMRATVDVAAGTMTFEPIAHRWLNGRTGGISAAIYGNQGVTVRIFNSPVVSAVNPTNLAKKTFTANVGIRNLLAYPIGDEQGGPAPADTMGLDVFMGSGPTVVSTSSPCAPACAVTVVNADGARPFNALTAQQYWHYHDRLGAAGTATDTTRMRKVWTFEADTQVTVFSFSVIVNAAWPAPHETRWKVNFEADSLPTSTAASRWTQLVPDAGGTITLGSPAPGNMTIVTQRKVTQTYARFDSLAASASAYMEVRMSRNDASNKPEEVVFGMADAAKFIAIGVTSSRVGFLTSTYQFTGTTFAVTTSSMHAYQLRKFASDSVQLLIDGVRVGSRVYSTLPNTAVGASSAFFFGGPGAIFPGPKNVADQSSTWDYLIYEIGVPTP
jgi:hypothetical protein